MSIKSHLFYSIGNDEVVGFEDLGEGKCFRPALNVLVFMVVYNKENLERQETNKYGRRTERHLPTTDESVVRPAGERH